MVKGHGQIILQTMSIKYISRRDKWSKSTNYRNVATDLYKLYKYSLYGAQRNLI